MARWTKPVGMAHDVTLENGTKIWSPSNVDAKARFGANCSVGRFCEIGPHVLIGNNVRIQAFTFIPTNIEIKDDVFIGPRVTFLNDKYPPSKRAHWAKTIIYESVSIGGGAIILPGLEIHKDSVIGAGAVVTRNVAEGDTVVGNPARSINDKDKDMDEGDMIYCGICNSYHYISKDYQALPACLYNITWPVIDS